MFRNRNINRKANSTLEMKRFTLILVSVVVSVLETSTNVKALDIRSYFDILTTKHFENQWLKYQASFENTLDIGLSTNFGHRPLNVFVRRDQNPLALTTGYYHTDNQVKVVFQNMALEAMPHVHNVDVKIPLHSNMLSISASVSKMIIRTTYRLFRYKSDIIFDTKDQNPYNSSPFRYQQVRNAGELAIAIEGCTISGIAIAKLCRSSVNLGHSSFNLSDCQYTIEIYSNGLGGPPVIAQYSLAGRGINLEHILAGTLGRELMLKLQGSMFSYINSTALITQDYKMIRDKQENFFDNTYDFMRKMVRNMNKRTMEKNMGTLNLGNYTVAWDDVFEHLPLSKSGHLFDMYLLGLDTLYSSETGGPFKLKSEIQIMEQLRFVILQVTGKIHFDGYAGFPPFAVELADLAVDAIIDENLKATFKVVGWRQLEFSSPFKENMTIESMVVGYLQRELPQHIINHLNCIWKNSPKPNQEASQSQERFMLSEEIVQSDPQVSETESHEKHLAKRVGGAAVYKHDKKDRGVPPNSKKASRSKLHRTREQSSRLSDVKPLRVIKKTKKQLVKKPAHKSVQRGRMAKAKKNRHVATTVRSMEGEAQLNDITFY